MNVDFSPREWLALVGAAVAVVAAFLPWQVTPGGAVAGVEGIGVVTLVVAGLAGGSVLLATWTEQGVVATTLGGVLVVLVAASQFLAIGGAVSPGIGLLLTVLGGLGLFAGGAWGLVVGERPRALGQ